MVVGSARPFLVLVQSLVFISDLTIARSMSHNGSLEPTNSRTDVGGCGEGSYYIYIEYTYIINIIKTVL